MKELQIATNLQLKLAHSPTKGFYLNLPILKNGSLPPIPFGFKVVSFLELLFSLIIFSCIINCRIFYNLAFKIQDKYPAKYTGNLQN